MLSRHTFKISRKKGSDFLDHMGTFTCKCAVYELNLYYILLIYRLMSKHALLIFWSKPFHICKSKLHCVHYFMQFVIFSWMSICRFVTCLQYHWHHRSCFVMVIIAVSLWRIWRGGGQINLGLGIMQSSTFYFVWKHSLCIQVCWYIYFFNLVHRLSWQFKDCLISTKTFQPLRNICETSWFK